MKRPMDIVKYISMLQRMNNMNMAGELNAFSIGCGQQFFLLWVSCQPGITLYDLAAQGHFDKATSTRAVHKLELEGYVKTEVDQIDKRVRHIFITEKGQPVVDQIFQILERWIRILLEGFREEEKQVAEDLLGRMVANAQGHLKEEKEREVDCLWNKG